MATVWNDMKNQDVWRSQTAFNAENWRNLVSRVKLLSVPFDKEYENVLKFDTDEERDAFFFDRNHGYEFDLETEWNFKGLEVFSASLNKHSGTVRIPLPYEAALNFNYMAVEMAMQPVPGQADNRREVYYYFLNSLNKLAPNATELFLELDTWMTYINSIKINQLSLVRGHYLHSQVDSEAFLENPIENSYGLLEPEIELPELKSQVASSSFVSMSKNAPRICVAMTGDLSDRKSWTTAVPTETIPNPDGHPVPAEATAVATSLNTTWNKNAFLPENTVELENYPSSGPKISVAQQKLGTGAVEGLRVYSIDPEDFPAFIGWARNNRVGIVKAIQAVYVLDSAVISEGSEFTAFGYTFREVIQDSSPKLLEELQLTENHFNYSAAARKWAKLYTGQFAKIEVSSGDSKAEISIEEVAKSLSFYARSSSLFPFLKLEALIDGVGGKGIKKYAVKPLKSMEMTSFNSRWSDFTFDLDVPVYSVYVAADQELGQEELEARKQAAKAIEQAKALDYESYMTKYGNSKHRIYEMLAIRTNHLEGVENARRTTIETSYNVAEMQRLSGYTLATLLSADPAYTMTAASALTARENTVLQYTAARTISEDSADTSQAVAATQASAANNIAVRSASTEYAVTMASADMARQQWVENEQVEMYATAEDNYDSRSLAYEDIWYMNRNMYDNGKDIYLKSAAMQAILSSATVSYGALGTGFGSLPGAGAASSGAQLSNGVADLKFAPVAGIAVDLLKMAIHKEVNGVMLEYQMAQANMAYGWADGESNTSFTALGETIEYSGNSLKWTEYETAMQKSSAEFTRDQSIMWRDFATGQTVREYNSLYDQRLAEENATRSQESAEANASVAFDASTFSYTQALQLAYRNAALSATTAGAVATASYATAINNAVLSKDTAYGYAAQVSDTSRDINNTNSMSAHGILTRDMQLARSNSEAQASMEDFITNEVLTFDKLKNKVDFNLARSETFADYLVKAQATPAEYGQASGKAWTDVWGRRGLELRVLRCTDAVAEQASNIFSRYGYRTPEIFVREPELKLMTGFTYWQTDEIWISGDRINETNKQIIRDTFSRGVTVWTDTETFFNVNLEDNQLLRAVDIED